MSKAGPRAGLFICCSQACRALGMGDVPLVVMTLQKRHNTRIFPEDKRPDSNVGGNVR